ncbi:MAG: hypothetical protein ABWZ80_10975 [Beijerinckiaceae bacterium]
MASPNKPPPVERRKADIGGMKLSKDAIEAIILVSGFALVAAAGSIVFLVWPTNIHGSWRIYLTLVLGALVVIPAMIALRRRLTENSEGDHE